MFFLGAGLAGDEYSADPTATYGDNVTSFKISCCEADHFFVTRDTEPDFECCNIPSTWDFYTILDCAFNGDLTSGNIAADMAGCDFLRIKRRLKNTYEWITLFELSPSTDDQGWSFVRYDKTARSNHTYDYAVVPVKAGIEGNLNIVSVDSDFDGIWIIDPSEDYEGIRSYKTIAEYDNVVKRNKPVGVIETLGSTYPFTVSNGIVNYDSGTVTGVFMPANCDDCEVFTDDNPMYRDQLFKFLTNGNEKLLKEGDGRAWLVHISGAAGESALLGTCVDEVAKVAVDWVENGDVDSGYDLYNNGFIDANVSDITVSYGEDA